MSSEGNASSQPAVRRDRGVGRSPHVLLLTHTFGFPEGYASTIRARLIARALFEAGADVRVLCTRHSEREPDMANTQSAGIYEGVEFAYTTDLVRRPSFLGRRLSDGRGLVVSLRTILGLRRAGRLDVVYLSSAGEHWSPLTETYLSFLNSVGVPVVLEVNELPWSQAVRKKFAEGILSPLHGATGVVAISGYLEAWARREGLRLRRAPSVLRVPILVDVDETQALPTGGPPRAPFVLLGGPTRYDLGRFAAAAVQQVWDRGEKCDLFVVGPWSDDDWHAQFAGLRTKDGDGSIVRLGRVPRETLLGLYQQAAVLLLPLDGDVGDEARFPHKLGEYLASARPVVTTSVGEVKRYLTNGHSAHLAPIGDVGAFAAGILEALKDPAAAREMGRRGREVAVREFDYRRNGGYLREWLVGLVGDGSRS